MTASSTNPAQLRGSRGLEAELVLGKAYDLRLIRRIAKYVRPHLSMLGAWLAFMLAGIGFDLAQPYLVMYSLQHHILTGKIDVLVYDALAYMGLVLGQGVAGYGEQWFLQLAGQRTMHDLRVSIFDHVLAQRAAFFDRIPVGRLMTRMTNDIESLNEMFSQGAITLIADAVKAIFIIAVMLSIDIKLSLMTFATLPLVFVLVELARRAMRTSFRQIRVRLAAMNAFAQEHLFGIRVVQLLGRSSTALHEYDEINAGHRDAYLLQIRADAAMYALVEAIGYIAIGLSIWFAAGHRASDAVTIGVVVAFIEYINKFFIPIRDLSAKYAVMQGAMAASERIFQLLDTDEFDGAAAPQANAVAPPEVKHSVPTASAPAIDSPPHSREGSAAHPGEAGVIDLPPHSREGSAVTLATLGSPRRGGNPWRGTHPGDPGDPGKSPTGGKSLTRDEAGVIDLPPHSREGSAVHPGEAGVIDLPPHSREGSAVTLGNPWRGTHPGEAGVIELIDVHFRYGTEPVLQGLDLCVPRGATVAVVGATGSGKSTVIKLLTRLYERDRGSILIDGVDVRDLPLADLRRRITVVSQDVTLFAGTLGDNVTLGTSHSEAAVTTAVRRVGLDRALSRRAGAGGLEEHVAERGANFSSGERQLVAFARALLRDPEVLVLDEATAHVDPEAEQLIEAGVDELMKGRTTLVIAHRLSTIRNADLIVVMDKGRVVEQGTHGELVAKGGAYATLEKTFRRHQDEVG